MQHFFQIRRIIVRISRTYISNIPLYSQQGRRLICSCQAFDYSFTSIRIAERERERERNIGKHMSPGPSRRGIIFQPEKMVLNFCPLGQSFKHDLGRKLPIFSIDRQQQLQVCILQAVCFIDPSFSIPAFCCQLLNYHSILPGAAPRVGSSLNPNHQHAFRQSMFEHGSSGHFFFRIYIVQTLPKQI